MLSSLLDAHVQLENDANLATMGEMWLGAKKVDRPMPLHQAVYCYVISTRYVPSCFSEKVLSLFRIFHCVDGTGCIFDAFASGT